MADLSTIPLIALSSPTKFLLATLLNPTKVIPSCDGLPRDWRGLADLFQLGGEMIPFITIQADPTNHILDTVVKKNPQCMVKELQTILERIDRWDIIDDAEPLFEKDARNYLERMEKAQTPPDAVKSDVDNQLLTIDDLHRVGRGLTTQVYDAFLLYADEDASFADEIIEMLEKKDNLKLCVKNRDLIGGVTSEHEAVMRLISERCNRLLIVLSPNFLKSPANQFFCNYAQAISIEKRQRKIIPCIYQTCEVPHQLMFYSSLHYNKSSVHYDFWRKLRASVRTVSSEPSPLESSSTSTAQIVLPEDAPSTNKVPEPLLDTPEAPKIAKAPEERIETQKANKSKLFSWSMKKSIPKPRHNDSTINLPSLEGLDSLESTSIAVEDTPKKEKKNKVMKACTRKIKSLVIKP